MDIKSTPIDQTSQENIANNTNDFTDSQLAQLISDSVSKSVKKRKIRHHSVTKREPTPIRYFEDLSTYGVNREKCDAAKMLDEIVSEKELIANKQLQLNDASGTQKITTVQNGEDLNKKGSISELAQNEIMLLFNKTKKSIASAAVRGQERFRKYEKQLVKRSQSAPKNNEGRLQKSCDEGLNPNDPIRRKHSDSDLCISTDLNSFSYMRERTLSKKCTSSNITEILVPRTSSLVSRGVITYINKNRGDCLAPLPIVSLIDVYQNYNLHKLQYKSDYEKIKSILCKCICELILIMIFCGLGGLIFKFTEGSFEIYYKCGVKRVKRDFIDLLWTKSHNLREDDWKSLARNKLRSFEEELHNAHEAGMTDYSGLRSWSFLNGIVYSLTIITTIGYGHMYPKTHTGRVLSIIYALIGIPLFLIALTDFGKLFTRGIKFIWSFVRRLYYTGSCRKARKTAAAGEIMKGAQMFYEIATFRRPSVFTTQDPTDSENPTSIMENPTTPAISTFEIDDEFNLPITVALFILVTYIICGAVMYMVIEKWDFFEAFYFVFISMSTIGFGDYVPRDPVFMIGSIIYLVFGLALMSMCINVVQAKLSETFKQASAKIGATMGLKVDEDGSIITSSPENVEVLPTFAPNKEKTNEEK